MKFLRLLGGSLLALILLELLLRLLFGFGTPVIYSASDEYEYIYAPNQDVHRYGNHILTNSFSMRSPEPSDSDSIRILYLGDSVINGGMHTSQDNLSSTLLAESLSKAWGKKVNVLNISAGSWGPDNAAAYLKKNGTFSADAMVLVFSSHDAFDNMTHEAVVDSNVHYPGHNPKTAISEVILRYLIPNIGKIFEEFDTSSNDKLMINNQRKLFNPGWQELIDIARADSIPVYVFMHAEQAELIEGRYNRYGQRIMDSLKVQGVKYGTGLEMGIAVNQYRDFIHLNDEGQAFLAEKLHAPISNMISQSARIQKTSQLK